MNTQGPGAVVAAPVMARTLEGGSNVAKSTCAVGDGRPVYGHGYCEAHAKRLRDRGDVMADIPLGRSRRHPESVDDRFWANVDASGDCWEWTHTKTAYGYGSVALPRKGGKTLRVAAHRYAWQALVGQIPDGLELDHLCRNRACINPAHLEPVTGAENKRRMPFIAAKVRKTHCPEGHPYSGENLVMDADARKCRECRKARLRRAYANRRIAA